MNETSTIDSLLEEGKVLSTTLSSKEKEKKDALQHIIEEKDKEIKAVQQQLFTHYQKALPPLLQEARHLMQTVPETPFELLLLTRNDGLYEGTEQYSRFSLLKNSDGTLTYTPETINWRDGGHVWNDFRKVTTLKEVLDSKETKQEDVAKMYETLKEFVIKYNKKTEKEVKNDPS